MPVNDMCRCVNNFVTDVNVICVCVNRIVLNVNVIYMSDKGFCRRANDESGAAEKQAASK
jgi:hypothetical protein